MSKIFRQPSAVSCFFCQSTVTPLPRNPLSFRCPHCECWNRYDANGEIISDEPAMHDENLNSRSFARRASPRKDRLPSMYARTVLCHTCQTNQVLRNNLLSNYLPHSDDPEYEQRLAALPEYQRSIELRYPLVCPNCLPIVEEKIRQDDSMARVRALGGFLQGTRGVDNRRHTSASQKDKDKLDRELRAWKVRGCLWIGTVAFVSAGYSSVILTYAPLPIPSSTRYVIPLVAVISIFWTAWDPTYSSYRRARFQGREIRVHGKREYNALQFIAWISRLCTSALLWTSSWCPQWDLIQLWDNPQSQPARIYASTLLCLEMLTLLGSWLVLHVQRPPPVRLMDTTSHTRLLSGSVEPPSLPSSRSVTPNTEPDLLASLTLSSKPVLSSQHQASSGNPIFGLPSFPSASGSNSRTGGLSQSPNGMDLDDDDDDRDPDAMDVDPSSPVKQRRNDDGAWMRPQRFFAPEEPTGLESLFARTIKIADSSDQDGTTGQGTSKRKSVGRVALWRWPWLVALLVIPLIAGGAFKAWDTYAKTDDDGLSRDVVPVV